MRQTWEKEEEDRLFSYVIETEVSAWYSVHISRLAISKQNERAIVSHVFVRVILFVTPLTSQLFNENAAFDLLEVQALSYTLLNVLVCFYQFNCSAWFDLQDKMMDTLILWWV